MIFLQARTRLGEMIMRMAIAAALLLAAHVSDVNAQDTGASTPTAEEEEGGSICVGGPDWYPTLIDVRDISNTPVPARYRAIFESTDDCRRFGLNIARIVDWHMNFGSLNSVTPALAYLEADYVAGVPPSRSYPSVLERAAHAAILELRAAAEARSPAHRSDQSNTSISTPGRAMRRFESLAVARERFLFLAEQYMRAAEAFSSVPLMTKAEQYLRPVVESAQRLRSVNSGLPIDRLPIYDLDNFRTEDLQMRAAILRAELSNAPTDIARAEAVVRMFEQPIYRRALETAFSGGDFCDISEGWSDAEQIESACNAEDDIQERVVNYWINRTALELIAGRLSEEQELTFRLLQFERLPERGRCCRRLPEIDLVRLLMLRADRHRKAFLEDSGNDSEYERNRSWESALRDLTEAERMAAAFEAPTLWRRIAEAWLDLWQRGIPVGEGEDRYAPQQSAEHRRYASYLRRLLPSLDVIAVGGDPGLN